MGICQACKDPKTQQKYCTSNQNSPSEKESQKTVSNPKIISEYKSQDDNSEVISDTQQKNILICNNNSDQKQQVNSDATTAIQPSQINSDFHQDNKNNQQDVNALLQSIERAIEKDNQQYNKINPLNSNILVELKQIEEKPEIIEEIKQIQDYKEK